MATLARCREVAETDAERKLVDDAEYALAFAFDDPVSQAAWETAKRATAPLCERALAKVGVVSVLSIPSATVEGKRYNVTRRGTNWVCECEAAKSGRLCWHVKAASAFACGATFSDAIAANKPARKALGPFAASMAGVAYTPPGSLTPKEREEPDAEPAAKTCFCCTGCGVSSGVRLIKSSPGSTPYRLAEEALKAKSFKLSHSRRWWCYRCWCEDYAAGMRDYRRVVHGQQPPTVDRVARGQSEAETNRAKWAAMGITEESLSR